MTAKTPTKMKISNLYKEIAGTASLNKKMLSVLIDPDKATPNGLEHICKLSNRCCVDYIFVGGSLLSKQSITNCISALKNNTDIPIILFPGNELQIDERADGILFLSLISGRNADMLIGKHVVAAPLLKRSSIEVIPTGYMLIDSGSITSALYMSNTMPIPYDKTDIASCTAVAGELLGMKLIYADGGSGALRPISSHMIKEIKDNISIPLIIGGGINTAEKSLEDYRSGADMLVVGTAFEQHPDLLASISDTRYRC